MHPNVRPSSVLVVLSSLVLLVACQTETASAEPSEATPSTGAEIDPCGVLTEADIRSRYSPPTDLEVLRDETMRFPRCRYRWDHPDKSENEAHNLGIRMKHMQDPDAHPLRIERYSVSITWAHPVDSAEEARQAYDAAVETMDSGGHVGEGGGPVEGVGDAAFWSARMNQLSVLSGTRIFHVSARLAESGDENRAQILEVGRLIASRL
jgi:hypothetical protein